MRIQQAIPAKHKSPACEESSDALTSGADPACQKNKAAGGV
jgi:hypothetical protein